MRDIKFKVFDSISKKMYSWDNIKHIPLIDFNMDHYTLIQYTGLKDYNGKEIYEGSILSVRKYENLASELGYPGEDELTCFNINELKGKLKEGYISEVIFEEGAFILNESKTCDIFLSALFGDMRFSYPIFEFRVIGNIHENPEYSQNKSNGKINH